MKNIILDENFGFVNLERACQILGMSRSWLYKATSRCEIPHYKIGSKLVFKIDELLKFMEGNRNQIIR